MVDTIKAAGAIPVLDDAGYTKIHDIYLKKHKDEKGVRGFVTDLSAWGSLISPDPKYASLRKSDYQFPYDDVAWMVNKNEHALLQTVEGVLAEMRHKNFVQEKCIQLMPWMGLSHCTI